MKSKGKIATKIHRDIKSTTDCKKQGDREIV